MLNLTRYSDQNTYSVCTFSNLEEVENFFPTWAGFIVEESKDFFQVRNTYDNDQVCFNRNVKSLRSTGNKSLPIRKVENGALTGKTEILTIEQLITLFC